MQIPGIEYKMNSLIKLCKLTVDVDAEAGPELCLGEGGVRVEVAVVPEVPGARAVPRRPTRVAHRHPKVAKLALTEHAVTKEM